MKYLFKNFINTLRHYKASSLLNIVGMAVAFAAFYVIMTQAWWGLTYNHGVEDVDRIFVISMHNGQDKEKWNIYFNRPLAEQLLASASSVESYGTASFYADVDKSFLYFKDGDAIRKVSVIEQQFSQGSLDVFGFKAEQGSFKNFIKPNALAVSSEYARANALKVGDQLSFSNTGNPVYGEIVAIWQDNAPKNTGPGSIEMISNIGNQYIDDWAESGFPYFVKLKNKDDVEVFEKEVNGMIKRLLEDEAEGNKEEMDSAFEQFKVTLLPFKEVYYRSDIESKTPLSLSGDKTTDVSLLVVAVLIILIALINFINFFYALVPARVRSVNTYKVFGTSRSTLVCNFVVESVGLVVLALMLAALIVLLFAKSSATEVLNAPIALSSNLPLAVLTIVIALACAVFGSVSPALYITSFQPAMVLKGTFGTSTSGRMLRNLLIGVQFTISLILIICAIFVKLQHNYMMNYDMGFNRQCLISGQMPAGIGWWGDKNQAFENKLRSNTDIVDITWSEGQIVNANRMGWGREFQGREIVFYCYPVAYNFLDVMGIEMAEGRKFTKADERAETGVLIFNEDAQKKFDITLEAKCQGHLDEPVLIAGICKNFSFLPLQYENKPMAFYVFGKDHSWRPNGLRHIYVRITTESDPNKVMEFIRNAVLELMPDVDPDTIYLHLFNEELASKYEEENKLGKQVTDFTIVAIVLALMGVFGLVLFETQHRKKEIAIRKVLGAEERDILTMLCRKYATIVLVCFVIAAPCSLVIVNRYISGFAYRTSISWWVFALALVVVLLVTILLVVVRSMSVARNNPVDWLKTE